MKMDSVFGLAGPPLDPTSSSAEVFHNEQLWPLAFGVWI